MINPADLFTNESGLIVVLNLYDIPTLFGSTQALESKLLESLVEAFSHLYSYKACENFVDYEIKGDPRDAYALSEASIEYAKAEEAFAECIMALSAIIRLYDMDPQSIFDKFTNRSED